MKIRREGSRNGAETTAAPNLREKDAKMPLRRLQDGKMMKNRLKMASNGPDGPILSIFGPFSALAFPFGQKNEKFESNKAFHHYAPQVARG